VFIFINQAYFRVWSRSLTMAELKLLADESLVVYNRPVITTPIRPAVFALGLMLKLTCLLN